MRKRKGLKTIDHPSTTAVKKYQLHVSLRSDHSAEQGRARAGAVQKPRLRRRRAQGDWVSEEAKAGDRAVVPDVTVVLRETGSWPWAVPESTENGR